MGEEKDEALPREQKGDFILRVLAYREPEKH